ncbi:MAG: hypothetical protein KF708_24005 [Pirellulales bacterium]|nr:hypothetical protein [Pirellulales bacterium]
MRLCGFFSLTLATLLVIGVAGDALAQRPGGGERRGFGGGFGGPVFLLGNESVQQELKLTDEQKQEAEKIAESDREAVRGLRDLPREQIRARIAERIKNTNDKLAKVLDAAQLKRLKQISWQQRGARAFSDPEVAEELKLTPAQTEQIETIQEDAGTEMRAISEENEGDREGTRRKFVELAAATKAKIVDLLTPDQQTKFKELLGEPFEGEIRSPFQGQGRRQRGNS